MMVGDYGWIAKQTRGLTLLPGGVEIFALIIGIFLMREDSLLPQILLLRDFIVSDLITMRAMVAPKLVFSGTDVREFLVQTSILERFNAKSCEALTGNPDSQGLLSELEQANLFLIPLDDERVWYRYHHLFADFLRTELSKAETERLYQKAALWHEQHDLSSEAVQYALASSDLDLLADGKRRGRAAYLIGLDPKTIDRHVAADPDFRELRDQAEARFDDEVEESVGESARSGNIPAAKMWLEHRRPEWREERESTQD